MKFVTLAVIAIAVAFAAPRKFGPLDPDVTNPAEFWMPLYNQIPQDYCENPRYPEVPTPGGIAMDILHEVYANGTVPNVPAKPTNIWQKNLWGFKWDDEIDWGAVYPYPYIIQPKAGLIRIMYPGAPVGEAGNRQMEEGFAFAPPTPPGHPEIHNASYPYITMSAAFDIGIQIYNGQRPVLRNISETGAIVDFTDPNSGNRTVATLYMVKGSPFINLECYGAEIAFGDMYDPPITGVDSATPGNDVPGSHFKLTTAAGPVHPQGVTWHAFFNHSVTLDLPSPPTTPINVTTAYTGLLQLGAGEIDDKMASFLTKASGSFAKEAHIEYDVEGDKASVIFKYVRGGNMDDIPLTMLALPHHVRLLPNSSVLEKTAYWCIKGNMTAVKANEWKMTYNLTSVGFGDRLKVDGNMSDHLLEAVMFDYQLRINMCPGDNATKGYPGYMNMELYAYVRDLAQYVDIAIILENLGQRTEATMMTKKVMKCMEPVLKRPGKPPRPCPPPINNSAVCVRDEQDVYYDTHWGGLVTNWFNRFAAHYCQCDKPGGIDACKGFNYCDNPRGWSAFSNYGNPFYNDHHFQYGYVVKVLGWAVYFQETKGADLGMNATVIKNITKKALAFARDIANPDAQKDKYFTFTRHKDIYDGHSWAEGYDYSGRILNWINQQSGGEAVNSYYGIYLLGLALNDTNVMDWGRIQMATEAFSIAQYQHISNVTEDKKDQPTKAINKWGRCLTILMGNGASGATYYGPNALFECGITILPINPYSREWIDPQWAMEAYDWIRWDQNKTGLCVFYDPETMSENPCPGPYNPSNWTGNEWACCPTNVNYADNQWRAYPNWFPYMYILLSGAHPREAWEKLKYTNVTQPTESQPFPYIAGDGRIVGYQSDITRSAALFHVATHERRHHH